MTGISGQAADFARGGSPGTSRTFLAAIALASVGFFPTGETVCADHGGPHDPDAGDTAGGAEGDLELADLHAGCPSVRDAVDAGCLDALRVPDVDGQVAYPTTVGERVSVLDRTRRVRLAVLDEYFLDRPVYSTLLPVPDAPVWRDVFDDPAYARDGTLRSLTEANCDVANGEIRANLADVCDVRSMVEQAVLLRECSRNHDRVLGYGHLDRELSKIERIVDNTVYWQRRNGIEEDVFRSAWLNEKCSAVPAGAMAPLDALRAPDVDGQVAYPTTVGERVSVLDRVAAATRLDHFGITADDIYLSHPPHSFHPDRPLDDHEVDHYMREEAKRLVEMAARLGDGWALSEFRGDAAHVERLFRSNPVQAYIHEVELEVQRSGGSIVARTSPDWRQRNARCSGIWTDGTPRSSSVWHGNRRRIKPWCAVTVPRSVDCRVLTRWLD